MRSVVVAVVLASACSSSSVRPPPPEVVRNTVPAAPDPHASRDALVKRAFAALADGDGKTLAALADTKNVMARMMRCDETDDPDGRRAFDPDREAQRVERRMREAAESAKGLGIEVVKTTVEEARGERMTAGTKLGGCELLIDIADERLKVDLRIKRSDGTILETATKVRVVVVEGRWYLHRVPHDLGRTASPSAALLEAMEDYSMKMCDCADKACAEKVELEYRAWITETTKAPHKYGAQTPDEAKRFAEAATRYAQCTMKLMAP